MQLQHHQLRTAQCPAWRVRQVQHNCSSTAPSVHPASTVPTLSQPMPTHYCPCSTPAASPLQHRPGRQRQVRCSASSSVVGAEEAMRLVQREGWKILDVRSARAWDQQHITKPARVSASAPVVLNDNSTPNPNFLADVRTGGGGGSRKPKLLKVLQKMRKHSTVAAWCWCAVSVLEERSRQAAAAGCLLSLCAGQLRQHAS